MAAPDTWYEKAFVTITKLAGTDTEYRTKTTSFSDSGASFDFEGIDTFGGRIGRLGSMDDIEISLDVVPVEATDFDTNFYGTNITAGTGSVVRSKYRVVMLWTDDTAVTKATQTVSSGSNAYRRGYAEFYNTNFESEFDANGNYKGTVTFKGPVVDKNDSLNIQVKSVTGSAALTSMSAYTTSNKF